MKEIDDRSICAGIVLFNPEIPSLIDNINVILHQVNEIVLIDNASLNIEQINLALCGYPNVYILRNVMNLGIAKALNQIFEWASQKGYSWVLTLDQDSFCSPILVREYKKYIDEGVGIISPIIHDNTDEYALLAKIEEEITSIDECITSGSLTSVTIWDKVGKFNELLFIDFVDFDFCIRVRLQGYKILRVNNTYINHQLGSKYKLIRLPFGMNLKIYNHSVERNYFYVRNNIYYIRKYWKHINKTYHILRLIHWEVRKIIFEPQKIQMIKSIIHAIKSSSSIYNEGI